MDARMVTFEDFANVGWEVYGSTMSLQEVFDLVQNKPYVKIEQGGVYSYMDYGMCSTYKVFCRDEYLMCSDDRMNWQKVAKKKVVTNSVCIYAD